MGALRVVARTAGNSTLTLLASGRARVFLNGAQILAVNGKLHRTVRDATSLRRQKEGVPVHIYSTGSQCCTCQQHFVLLDSSVQPLVVLL